MPGGVFNREQGMALQFLSFSRSCPPSVQAPVINIVMFLFSFCQGCPYGKQMTMLSLG